MPTDRGIIDRQLQELGDSSRWWNQRELRDLPAVLDADERILAISRGKIGRPRMLRRSHLIVVTNRRLLCMRSGKRASWRQVEVDADEITRVSIRIGPFRGRLLIAAGGSTYRLLVRRADAYMLQSALSSLGTATDRAVAGFAPTRMMARMLDHVLALPAVALAPERANRQSAASPAPQPEPSVNDERLDELEREVHELREQIAFLEQLLRERHAPALAGERSDRA